MKILLCNPKNSQGTKHSRKGMYVPLGILSIATYLDETFRDSVHIDVCDEDVAELSENIFPDYNVVGFYSTTFNYKQAVRYAYLAKEYGCITVLGGPHASVLFENILVNRSCFDYIIRFEAEYAFKKLVEYLLYGGDPKKLADIPNLAFKDSNQKVLVSPTLYENVLTQIPIPSRAFIQFESYIKNYQKMYPEKQNIRPGSIYSSKGCSWRDKTDGCVFCARLEEGVRFRDIDQIWSEIKMLKEQYDVNSIWDIADDNLNNKNWFIEFVKKKPKSCKDLTFFIYSRANCIKPWVIDYFHELNVMEVFIGVESGDNRLLRESFKGQTRESTYRALKILNDHHIKFYPSFVLGLPGESEESLNNTLNLCQELVDLGGLDRLSTTILKPIPGSRAYDRVLQETRFGRDLVNMDDIDLGFLEKYWIDRFTDVSYATIENFRDRINEIMEGYHVFGGPVDDRS